MDLSSELATYLQTAGFGTVGTSIFIGQIPEGTNGLYILNGGGQLGKYVPVNETVLDIYCKNTKASTCITTLNNVKNYIHRMHNTTTANAYIYSILVIGDTQDVARDLEYAKVYKITVSILNRDTSVIS
jgi:hypothetical protein